MHTTWTQLCAGLGIVAAHGVIAVGCGSSSSGGGDAPATAADAGADPAAPAPTNTQQPAPPPPAPPQGGGGGGGVVDPLDTQLQADLAAAGVTAPTPAVADAAAMVTLGEALFFDKLLSGNRNISCATCHHPDAASGDGLPLSLGEGAVGAGPLRQATVNDQVIPRNAPHVFNAGLPQVPSMFWDGRITFDAATGVFETPEPGLNGAAPTLAAIVSALDGPLAAQAMFPVTSREEMRGDAGDNELADATTNEQIWSRIMARLVGTNNGTVGGFAQYRTLFNAAFPGVANFDDLNFGHAATAIAAYERTAFTFLNTPLDQYLAGNTAALSDQAKRGGLVFFGAGRCDECHNGPLLSDFEFHAIASPQLGPGKDGASEDLGRELISGNAGDRYRFRTPPLRNVELTGPFFHSGAFTTLGQVLQHYRNPTNSLNNYTGAQLPPFFQALVDLDATRQQARANALSPRLTPRPRFNNTEQQDLLAFLQALTDPAARTLRPPPATVPSGLAVAD